MRPISPTPPLAKPDAAPPKAAGVTVTVTRSGAPAAGIKVVFNDAAGAILQVLATGADGKATSTGATPASASALLGGSAAVPGRRLVTWVDVKPGDVLSTLDLVALDIVARYDVSYDPFDGAATTFIAATGDCTGVGASPIALVLTKACLDTSSSILGTASDNSGNTVGFAFKKGNSAPAADGGASAVALGPWAAPDALAVNVTNPPAGSIDALVAQVSGGATFLGSPTSFVGSAAALGYSSGFAEALEPAIVSLNPGGGGTRAIVKRMAPVPTVTFDFATALPVLATGSNDNTNLTRPVVSWTANAPLTVSDGGNVSLRWSDTIGEVDWTFIVPPTATNLKAPQMPPEAAPWLPTSTSAPVTTTQIVFADLDFVSSYDAFRSAAGRVAIRSDLFAGALLPQNGTLKTTTLSLPLD